MSEYTDSYQVTMTPALATILKRQWDELLAERNSLREQVAASNDLRHLHVAAEQWLKENPDDPNAPTLRQALVNTRILVEPTPEMHAARETPEQMNPRSPCDTL